MKILCQPVLPGWRDPDAILPQVAGGAVLRLSPPFWRWGWGCPAPPCPAGMGTGGNCRLSPNPFLHIRVSDSAMGKGVTSRVAEGHGVNAKDIRGWLDPNGPPPPRP